MGHAEDEGGDAERRHGEEQGPPDVALQGPDGEAERHHRRPDAAGGAQPPKADGADVQLLLADGGEEGDGATEEHGEQVE